MNDLRRAVLVLLLVCSSRAMATDTILISCAGAPADAVLQLPAPLSQWGEMYCTRFGHTLGAKEGWVWSYPGAFSSVHLPAQMVRAPQEVNHAAYFKRIELTSLSGLEATVVADKINHHLGAKADSPVSSAYRLVLTNQDGASHTILFSITAGEAKSGKGHWGFWCDEGCKGGLPFMLLNMSGN